MFECTRYSMFTKMILFAIWTMHHTTLLRCFAVNTQLTSGHVWHCSMYVPEIFRGFWSLTPTQLRLLRSATSVQVNNKVCIFSVCYGRTRGFAT